MKIHDFILNGNKVEAECNLLTKECRVYTVTTSDRLFRVRPPKIQREMPGFDGVTYPEIIEAYEVDSKGMENPEQSKVDSEAAFFEKEYELLDENTGERKFLGYKFPVSDVDGIIPVDRVGTCLAEVTFSFRQTPRYERQKIAFEYNPDGGVKQPGGQIWRIQNQAGKMSLKSGSSIIEFTGKQWQAYECILKKCDPDDTFRWSEVRLVLYPKNSRVKLKGDIFPKKHEKIYDQLFVPIQGTTRSLRVMIRPLGYK